MLIAWLLFTYGLTLVVTGSRVTAPLRRLFSFSSVTAFWVSCPMCVGWWVGTVASLAGFSLLRVPVWPIVVNAVANGFCSAGWCWIVHVSLAKLGAEEL